MASKKFIIEVEEGQSNCKGCALYVGWRGCIRFASIDCAKYDYSTMKISEYNQEKNNTMSKSLRRSVIVDFNKMFEDLSYSDQVSFLADKMCDCPRESNLKRVRFYGFDLQLFAFDFSQKLSVFSSGFLPAFIVKKNYLFSFFTF